MCDSCVCVGGIRAEAYRLSSDKVWDGVWTDSLASDGYGGEFRICTQVQSGVTVMTGVYSEVGEGG